jgi:hypothetical protein
MSDSSFSANSPAKLICREEEGKRKSKARRHSKEGEAQAGFKKAQPQSDDATRGPFQAMDCVVLAEALPPFLNIGQAYS